MLHKKSLIIASLSLLILFGCKDDAVVSSDVDLSTKQLSKIVTDSENYNIFLYSGKRLMKYESVQNNLTVLSISFRYQEDGRIESEEVIQNRQDIDQRLYKYIYDAYGKITQIEFSLKENYSFQKRGSFSCNYNLEGKLVKTVFRFDSQTSPQETEYSYYANGNTKEKIRYLDGKLYDKVTYEYDDKKNPANAFYSTAYCGMVIQNNNMVKTTTESYIEPKLSRSVFNYTYGDDGYPLQRVIVYTDDKNNNIQKTEEYKYN